MHVLLRIALASAALVLLAAPLGSATASASTGQDEVRLAALVESLAAAGAIPADLADQAQVILAAHRGQAGMDTVIQDVAAALLQHVQDLGLDVEAAALQREGAPGWVRTMAGASAFVPPPTVGPCEDKCNDEFYACIQACHSATLACVAFAATDQMASCTMLWRCEDLCEMEQRLCVAACKYKVPELAALSNDWAAAWSLAEGCGRLASVSGPVPGLA